MSELKVYHCNEWKNEYTEFYIKSEADKVFADLEESHKKEVGQLLIEIAELKKERNWLAKDRAQAYSDLEKRAQLNIKQEESIRHHKYKLCLAMAQEWRNYASFCGMQSSCHNHRGFGKTAEKYTWKEFHAWKCVKRWIAIAEKFKPNPTINRKGGTNALQR